MSFVDSGAVLKLSERDCDCDTLVGIGDALVVDDRGLFWSRVRSAVSTGSVSREEGLRSAGREEVEAVVP